MLCGLVLASSMVQGGYFHTVFLVAGLLLAVRCIPIKRRLTTAEIALWALSALYLMTALLNGYSSDSLAQACLPGAVAASLYCYEALEQENKELVLRVLAYVSVGFVCIGIPALCGVWDISGAVTARRLQFPFQYANAAGSWYAALALLRQGDEQKKTRWDVLPLQTALFLTRSLGALGLYGIAELAVVFRERKTPARWQAIVISNAFSAAFAVGFYLLRGWWAILLLAAMFRAGVWERKLCEIARKIHLHWLLLAAGAAAIYPIFRSGRVVEGLLTFTERLYQIRDGARIIAEHPLTGIGAGRWEYLYPYWQSARYVTTVVHSSIIQMGVDAGVLAIVLGAGFALIAWRSKNRLRQASMAALLLLVHSLLDFNFQFYPVCCLTVFLLCSGEATVSEKANAQPRWLTTVKVSFAVLCVVLLAAEMNYKQLVYSNAAGDWTGALARYETCDKLFGTNPAARKSAAYAAYWIGDRKRCLALTDIEELLDTEAVILHAEALRSEENTDTAEQYLLDIMERRQYQRGLYQLGGDALQRWDAGEEALLRYRQIEEERQLSDFERRVEAFKKNKHKGGTQ